MSNKVPKEFYDAVVSRFGEPFAYSYLSRAVMSGARLLPGTQTAWMRLRENRDFAHLLVEHGLKMVKPPPFQPPVGYSRAA